MKKFAYITLVFVCSVHALAVPQLISYQGSLTDSTGNPLDTTVSITFSIFDASAGGMNLWTETHPSVVIENGLFQVLLGSVTALSDLFSANRWLGVTVGGDTEMSPRQQIVSVAHAYRVGTVAGASGGSISGNVTITGKATIGNGHVNSGTRAFVAGSNNKATGDYSVISGGGGAAADSNSASGINSVIGGGLRNQARGPWTTISGGSGNIADSGYATIAGGWDNSVSHFAGVVSGGVHNFARGAFSTVAGGGGTAADSNVAGGDYSVIGGGAGNDASGFSSTIAGGARNIASGSRATVGGGRSNRARGDYSVVAGGGGSSLADSNSVGGDYSSVGGGTRNTASGDYSAVAGGQSNTASGFISTVAGGGLNAVSGEAATVGGGQDNSASLNYATVGGGFNNTALGFAATIGGGSNNTASGSSSMIVGGANNEASQNYCFSAGNNSHATNSGCWVITDGTGTSLTSNASNQFSSRFAGGYRLYSNTAHTAGVTLAAGGNAWVGVSDSTKKRDIRLTNTKSILEKMSSLPIKNWEYKSEAEGIEHLGPMAQDFWNAFHLGSDSLGIATNDADGVLFAAVQELNKRNEQLQATNQDLQNQINQLRSLVQTIASERQQSSKR